MIAPGLFSGDIAVRFPPLPEGAISATIYGLLITSGTAFPAHQSPMACVTGSSVMP
jgi:hypothetical protein